MAKHSLFLILFLSIITFLCSTLNAQPGIQTTQKTIVVDPGHGGKDTGLVSILGQSEKKMTLRISRLVAKNLEDHYNIVLTRTDDQTIRPEKRVGLANLHQADLFVSIHLSNHPMPAVFGYYYALPNQEDIPNPLTGSNWKAAPLKHQTESKRLLKSFEKTWDQSTTSSSFKTLGAPLISLQGTTMPGVMIEVCAIMSLPKSDTLDEFIASQATLIASSIHDYLSATN